MREIPYGHLVNECSGHDEEHTEECNGDCEKEPLSDLKVDILNEITRWDEAGMVIRGVPMSLMNKGIDGIGVEIFELECRFAALVTYLDELGIIDKDKASEFYQKRLLEKLTTIRNQAERARARAQIEIAPADVDLRKIKLGENGDVTLH